MTVRHDLLLNHVSHLRITMNLGTNEVNVNLHSGSHVIKVADLLNS